MTRSATDTPAIFSTAVDRMAWARRLAESLVAAVPDEQVAFQPGGRANHALWVMGHLAFNDDFIRTLCTGEPSDLPPRYAELFSAKTKPVGDPDVYPPRDELLDAMRATRQRTLEWMDTWTPERYHTPTPESIRAFAPDWIALPYTHAAHDLFHAGQVASCRAALGLDPIHA